ncbi:ABC transporter permease [Ligilactobacillus apodemi]|uniref:ABC transporter permease n=1 Tax=Ligilactobacillus apodemi TaxID=307126 RepID=UPI00214BFF37|nr:ABC transporter permease [Ligilactobacillus apodemi]MCR1900850.1 ABC transporter permease [Ligilactobacillus apodemi]
MRLLRCTWNKSFKQFMIYRTTGWLTFWLALVFYVIEYVSGYVYFSANISVNGWNRSDYLLLVTGVALMVALYNFIFILGHETLSYLIISGELDRLLIRPLDPYWSLVLSGFDLPSLLELLVTMVIFLYLLQRYTLGIMRILMLVVTLFLGVMMIFLLNRICICLNFWLTKANALGGIVEDLTSMLSRPRVFFPLFIQLFFTFVVPILTVTNLPVEIIKGDASIIF